MKPFKILFSIAAVMFTAALAITSFPEIIPKVADTLHISVDTIAFFVQWFGQSAGVTTAACTIVAHSETCDDEGNEAGINTIWFTGRDNIDTITVSGRQITAITMVSGKIFYKWTFEDDTAFFNQPKTVNNGVPFYKPTLNFTNKKIATSLISAIEALDNCSICGVIAIVKDNNGKKWLAGVKWLSGNDFIVKPLKPDASDGASTGANSESDQNKITTQLVANQGKLSLEVTIADSSIPVV